MVCIAAFIILAIIGIFVAILSIFKKDIGRKYWKVFKKSWHCFTHHITFRKCDTNFKDDVKNVLLKKVVIKHPKAVKPLSATIEVTAVLIVFVSIWSLATAVKSGLALWTLGSCNVRQPSACSLGAEACGIDSGEESENILESIGHWFTDWGEIFGAIPDKFKNWDEYFDKLDGFSLVNISGSDKPKAVDILDPGCSVCASSFKTQLESGFFENNETKIVPFPIQDENGKFKFKNSEIIVRYVLAMEQQGLPLDEKDERAWSPAFKTMKRVLTENGEKYSYQQMFNELYSAEEAEATLQAWLKEFGYHSAERSEIIERAHSDQITEIIKKNNEIVVNEVHAKGIPTMIYDGRKHTGKYEAK